MVSSANKQKDELQVSESESHVNQPEYSQTMTTALQVALVDLLRSWNLVPRAVVGHSSGEIAAAYVMLSTNVV